MKKIFYLFTLLLISTLSFAQEEDKWTPEDIIHTKYVSSPTFSPNGDMVLWSQRKGLDKEDKFVNDLYLARLNLKEKGMPRVFQFTRSKDSDYNAIFSRDGESVYFLSSRDKGKKLWRMSLYGGEPEEVHEFENGISSLQWKSENEILFVSSEGKTLYDIKNKDDNTQIIEDTLHWNPVRIFSFDVKDKKITRITENDYRASSYTVSRDGKYLIYRLILSPDYGVDGNPKPKYYLKNLETGTEKEILKGLQSPGNFQFTASSGGFYFLATKSSNPEWNGAGIQELYFYDLPKSSYTKVDLKWENGVAYSYYISGEDVIAQLANGPLKEVAAYRKSENSWEKQALGFGNKGQHVDIQAISDKGDKIIYRHSTASSLPEYYYADLEKGRRSIEVENETKLVSLNDGLKKKQIAKSEIIYWKGANDEEVNGILYYPKNYEEGKKYPLILSIHGGPTGVDQDEWSERWSTYPQIYTDKGAFVLKPNYHGSGSHSLEFIESIKGGNYYKLEQIDLYNGIEFLNKKGMVDMNKLGTMGWSNGAILTTMLTLKYPDLFKVAAPGAGDVNWTSDYGTCQFGVTFDQSYFGGAPWDDTNGKHYNEWYIENSPIFEIEKIKTPTIIFHGSEDRAVPRDQGWEYYRGLQQVGQAPVKFLWFPGQPHGLQKITHQMRKMKEEIAWIDKYLFGIENEENESFKEDSPLATRLLLAENSKVDGFYGEKVNNVLVPEMVQMAKDSIWVSKFELTVAQYYASQNDDFNALTGNLPMTSLSQEQIEKYISWLNENSDYTFRLPNEMEAKKMHKLADKNYKNQNNLNYWAGYDLTIYDVNGLREKLEGLDESLIKEVGSHDMVKITDKVKLFDIGGNAAEYYKDANNNLKTYDYSAYDFVDPYKEYNNADKEYTAVRLIRE